MALLRYKFEMFVAADINMTSQNYHDHHNVIRKRTQLGVTHLSWRLDNFSMYRFRLTNIGIFL